MDDKLRQLERQAKAGDGEAAKKLAVYNFRRGVYIFEGELPTLKLVANRQRQGGLVRSSRNWQKYKAHISGRCSKSIKCRYCRRYGPIEKTKSDTNL